MVSVTQAMIDDFNANETILGVDNVPVSVGDTISSGDNVTADAKTGFLINSIEQYGGYDPVTGGSAFYEFTVVDGGNSAYWAYDSGASLTGFTFNVETAPVEGVDVTQTVIDNYASKNVILGVDYVPVSVGDFIPLNSLVTIAAVEGFIIIDAEFSYYDVVEGVIYYSYTINTDQKSGEILYDSTNMDEGIKFASGIATEEEAVDVQGTNNVYLVDNDVLKQINNNRFVPNTNGDGSIDYGQYILSLISLPTELNSELILEKNNVILGDRTLTVTANVIASDAITINMGVITVPEITGDLRDFSNVNCILHLPYSQPLNIDAEYVIGQTLTIEYIVDAYTGESTINIGSSKVGEVFISQQSTLGINIPYSLTKTDTANTENSNIALGGDNRITKPYIEIIRNEALLVDGVFTIPVIDEDSIINHTGFIKVEEIELEINSTYSEKESVVNALRNGVIIK